MVLCLESLMTMGTRMFPGLMNRFTMHRQSCQTGKRTLTLITPEKTKQPALHSSETSKKTLVIDIQIPLHQSEDTPKYMH